jgi:hypothetical protein
MNKFRVDFYHVHTFFVFLINFIALDSSVSNGLFFLSQSHKLSRTLGDLFLVS